MTPTFPMVDAFQRGIIDLNKARAGDPASIEHALLSLHACLEYALPEQSPAIWREALLALAEIYDMRTIGDKAMNQTRSKQCRRKALT